jgi:hypothetical protein
LRTSSSSKLLHQVGTKGVGSIHIALLGQEREDIMISIAIRHEFLDA